jgi:hypothetical protein
VGEISLSPQGKLKNVRTFKGGNIEEHIIYKQVVLAERLAPLVVIIM